jgi:OmpA-OmpF porin, OOP family
MSSRPSRALAAGMLCVLLAGCAWNRETVVLLPDKDEAAGKGRPPALSVTKGPQEVVLDRPYASFRQSWYAGSESYTASAAEVEATFANALAAQPKKPKTYTLYFVEASDELTADSKRYIEDVLSEITGYAVPDIVVVGHTDAVGSDQYNDALSLDRAKTVRTALIDRGIAPENIVAVGRGKRQPFRSTPGVLSDPANRRVEIIVR